MSWESSPPESYDFELPPLDIYCPSIEKLKRRGGSARSATKIGLHKKCHRKRKETEATEDRSAESSENDLGISGENASSNEEKEFVGK